MFVNGIKKSFASGLKMSKLFSTSSIARQAQTVNHDIEWKNPYPEAEFSVGPKNGFLPKEDPLITLPEQFSELEALMEEMPINKTNGQKGLLYYGDLGQQVLERLPQYDLSNITDQRLLSALFRDYTYLASAYLLEPCDIKFRASGVYGLARENLIKQIAVPLETVSKKIHAKPFMEYAMSYALYNYKKLDVTKPPSYENVELIRGFSKCTDEHGFILVHVDMVRYSGQLVTAAMDALEAVRNDNRDMFNKALSSYFDALLIINTSMETMWKRSDPDKYLSFRTFIMGTKNNPMFPNGVFYEGSADTSARFYRGESGANDSMVPLSDNLFELTSGMPSNPLTAVLRDFRSYRPANHEAFLAYVEKESSRVGLLAYAEKDALSSALLLRNLDQIRDFRHRHWTFTVEYIIKNSDHPTATGGSPIVTWLPNQLRSVLKTLDRFSTSIDTTKLDLEMQDIVHNIRRRAVAQVRALDRQVNEFQEKRFVNQEEYQG
ncbi:Indoleamine 2,3-dioxygenase 1 [Smittium mucronatum]|uniref:Indoleamine 2,3-dioxygenase 1 n=1 Tax=Smittium mucronatum TaxID=133383 RepID=A0A1R0GMC5_9FUNG|nr:Indoleamine 2,3-dioxygenase 1 [Smittium mucronatum]